MSGTNAHLILEQPPIDPRNPMTQPEARAALHAPWLLSAREENALRAQAQRLRDHMLAQPSTDPADIGYTLATARPGFTTRAAIFGNNPAERAQALAALADGNAHPALVRGSATTPGRTVFVFPGQGSQWPGMGADLLDTSPVFAEWIDRCEQALASFVDWSLSEVLRDTDATLEQADVVQPALWAVMVSLAETWRARGVEPDAVIGHSQGEIAAAYLAGILTLDDAARIVVLRSRIITDHLAGTGTMMSIALPAEEVQDRLDTHPEVSVATLNGPQSTVVAGPRQRLEVLAAELEQHGVQVRRIPVDYASHTPHVDRLRADLDIALAPIAPQSGRIAFYSTVTGTHLNGTELTTDYWFRNLRQPVLF
ncbi:acyltransferase domain-containing protein, partial [Nocardia sp. NPDC004604]|uniref:acyltransferase domain-containing protein n=1 Tax=Nocardia sp. NPDC004604 TaxID=3157013 RepID=UPI0033AEB2B1